MLVNEFISEVQSTYNKHFPKSKCFVKLVTNLYPSIDIACYLANDKTELYNGYWENDIFKIRFTLDTEAGEFSRDIGENSVMPSNLKLEADRKSYFLKASNPHMAYDSRSLSFRKTKGDAKKIIATLDKFFKKVYEELQKDIQADLIANSHKELVNSKF